MGNLLGIALRERARAPMLEVEEAEVSDRGVGGDSRALGGTRAVTVLSRESWEAACIELDREVPWTARRANLLVEDASLVDSVGSRLAVGAAILEVTGETTPCERMNEAMEGLRACLVSGWRGGVTCRVVSPGRIRVGDAVTVMK